mgnify:CR=1 FL=1
MSGVDELTPVAQDYLKVIWSATEWGDPPITTKGLAARLGTSQANVSDTVKRLAAQGLQAWSGGPEAFSQQIRADYAKYGAVVRQAGIQFD